MNIKKIQSILSKKSRDELNIFAKGLGVSGYRKLNSKDLIDKILSDYNTSELKKELKLSYWDVNKNLILSVASVLVGLIGIAITLILTDSDENDQSNAIAIQKRLDEVNVTNRMIAIPAGILTMGNNRGEGDERPEHIVKIEAFLMDSTEVTNEQYCEFLNSNMDYQDIFKSWIDLTVKGNEIEKVNGEYVIINDSLLKTPVRWVTWFGAQKYAEWNNNRLPTEAEWEYAAKGISYQSNYGECLCEDPTTLKSKAWYLDNSNGFPHQVAKKKKNSFGLYDMNGNVWEWCSNWYNVKYIASKDSTFKYPPSGENKVRRGGSYDNSCYIVRTSCRGSRNPKKGFPTIGFRTVRSLRN